jgi:hypothetical protein
VVYVGSGDGRLYAFHASGIIGCSGTPKMCSPLWTGATGALINLSSPAIANGFIYVGSTDHKLYAFSLPVGRVISVRVDIKPGSPTDPINLSSSGVIPVAILSTRSFDATSVDASSVCFGDDNHPAQRDCTEAHGTGHLNDIDGDGDLDLVLHFETQQAGIDPGDTKACLTGSTVGRTSIAGCDRVTAITAAVSRLDPR